MKIKITIGKNMKFSRRDLLKFGAYATGSIFISSGLQGCDLSDSDSETTYSFDYGVASGDPLVDSVILWTRVTPSKTENVTVTWEVATDETFTQLVNIDQAVVNADRDYTVKVEVQRLEIGRKYYYRFIVGKDETEVFSPVGQTKTLPGMDVSEVKLAVFSCANYPAGFFNVYAEAAKMQNLDAVVHLGDYIYEYAREYDGVPAYASQDATTLDREVLPANELLSLTDYRTRYAQYRRDVDLQALHAIVPFIAVWDDHEIANDTYVDGAQNHDPATEGSFEDRKAAAIQAYFEWLPLRPVVADAAGNIYRQFEFGSLVNLLMLDTRVIGRDKQLDYADYIDATTGAFNAAGFVTDVTDKNRTLLGLDQRDWLTSKLAESTATWQVLGQQVLMTKMLLPSVTLTPTPTNPTVSLAEYGFIATSAYKYQALLAAGVPDNDAALADATTLGANALTGDELAVVRDSVQMGYLNSPKIPYNLDAWDGYAYDREVVLGTAKAYAKNLISLAGDTHNSWQGVLTDQYSDEVGTEFAVTSVSSPGLEEYLGIPNAPTARATEPSLVALIEDLKYCNIYERGLMVVTFNASSAQAEWIYVSGIKSKEYSVLTDLTTLKSVDLTG
jgi:alkaline phosphatase D